MRLTSLRPWPGGPEIRLHPRITLLIGLLPFERVELVSTAHSLALGEEPVWDGLVEVAGIEMTLTEVAEVVGRTADAAPVITAAAIPAGPSTPSIGGPVSDAESSALADLCGQLDEIAGELASAGKLRAEMNARITSARANVDEDAFERLDRVDAELRRAADQAGRPDPWTGMSDVGERMTELQEALSDLEVRLSRLPTGDRVSLAEAVAAARVSLSEGDSHLPAAARMLEAWCLLEGRRRSIEARFMSQGLDHDGALARLESSRAALRAAEEAATPRAITAEEAAEVEQAHDRLVIHHDRASAGLRRGAARRRMDDAQTELTAILDSLGYVTWSQLRMGNGMVQVTEESMKAYETARAELNAAELEWAQIATALETDPELREIDAAMDEVHSDAVRLLGHDPLQPLDLAAGRRMRKALADVKVDASSSSLDPHESTEALRMVLDDCGSPGQRDLTSRRGVLALGESWLAMLRDSEAARIRILHDRRRVTLELDALGALGDVSRVDRLDSQRATVREAESAASESREALCSIADARIELHVLAATELELAEEHDAKAELLVRARPTAPPGTSITERLVVEGPGGALPIVIIAGAEEPFRLDPLLALPEDVQVIIVGDGDPLLDWARSLGSDRASVVDRGVLV